MPNPKKIHLGCGGNVISGWDNLDMESGQGVIVYDLRKPLPYEDGSVSKIFSEHVIEHLDKESGYRLLSDCNRVLIRGGAIRIGWPDLSKLVWAYLFRKKSYKNFVLPHLEGTNQTGSWDETLSDCLFSWGHKYAYTRRYLSALLAKTGFAEIKQKGYRESDHQITFDVRNDPATVYLEALKP